MVHMTDSGGSTPLSYVRKEHCGLWIEFLDCIVDLYRIPREAAKFGEEAPPPLVLEKPNSCPLRDPENALPLALAAMVTSGRMEPDEAALAMRGDTEDDTSSETSGDDYGSELDESEAELEEELVDMLNHGPLKICDLSGAELNTYNSREIQL